MAINLTVSLTDAEQAKLLELANLIAPNMSPAEVKVWAERHAKIGLRQIVQLKYSEYQQESMENIWPVDLPVAPPPSE